VKQIRIWQQWPAGWSPTFQIIPLEPPTYALVDDCDYDWLSERQWFVMLDSVKHINRKEGKYDFPNPRCIITPADTFIGGMGAYTERMSKMIIQKYGGPHTRYILHKDGNQLNNQRDNLLCTNNNRALNCGAGGVR
jgi:hypothetical protein